MFPPFSSLLFIPKVCRIIRSVQGCGENEMGVLTFGLGTFLKECSRAHAWTFLALVQILIFHWLLPYSGRFSPSFPWLTGHWNVEMSSSISSRTDFISIDLDFSYNINLSGSYLSAICFYWMSICLFLSLWSVQLLLSFSFNVIRIVIHFFCRQTFFLYSPVYVLWR